MCVWCVCLAACPSVLCLCGWRAGRLAGGQAPDAVMQGQSARLQAAHDVRIVETVSRSEGAATELRLYAVLVDPTVTVVVLCQPYVHMHACAQPQAGNHVCASLAPTDRQDERSMGGMSPALMQMWEGRAQSRCRCSTGEPIPGGAVAWCLGYSGVLGVRGYRHTCVTSASLNTRHEEVVPTGGVPMAPHGVDEPGRGAGRSISCAHDPETGNLPHRSSAERGTSDICTGTAHRWGLRVGNCQVQPQICGRVYLRQRPRSGSDLAQRRRR